MYCTKYKSYNLVKSNSLHTAQLRDKCVKMLRSREVGIDTPLKF